MLLIAARISIETWLFVCFVIRLLFFRKFGIWKVRVSIWKLLLLIWSNGENNPSGANVREDHSQYNLNAIFHFSKLIFSLIAEMLILMMISYSLICANGDYSPPITESLQIKSKRRMKDSQKTINYKIIQIKLVFTKIVSSYKTSNKIIVH